LITLCARHFTPHTSHLIPQLELELELKLKLPWRRIKINKFSENGNTTPLASSIFTIRSTSISSEAERAERAEEEKAGAEKEKEKEKEKEMMHIYTLGEAYSRETAAVVFHVYNSTFVISPISLSR